MLRRWPAARAVTEGRGRTKRMAGTVAPLESPSRWFSVTPEDPVRNRPKPDNQSEPQEGGLLVIRIMGGFENVQLSLAGWIACMLGVVVTSVLGVVLTALLFHSDRSGRDESAGEPRREVDRKA